jgi:tetratricopeptide (TPR) repeat protein
VTAIRPNLVKILAPAAIFACLVGVLLLVNRSPSPRQAQERVDAAAPARSTDGRIAQARLLARAEPSDPRAYALLGDAYVQKARETGDPNGAWIGRAEHAYRSALRRDPRYVAATIGLGVVALNGHDFARALEYGLEARRLEPHLVQPYSVVVDAQIELGRYRAAGRSLQRMLDLKPNLASYARASYYRELHGDLSGALEAMELAASAGGDAPEQVAYVQTLVGDLHLHRADTSRARAAYALALSRLPNYVDARFGLARTAAQAGAFPEALGRLRGVVAERPDPDHLLLLAEVELRLGRDAAGRAHIARARAREAAALGRGSRPDAGVVLLEASHGDRPRALRFGREVWRRAPSVTSADALGWALTRAGRPRAGLLWARRALHLGTRSPTFHYHAGMAARGAERPDLARRHLRRALRLNPAFSPLEAPKARRALAVL